MSRAIHQLVHTLSYGDAISGETLALQRCLQRCGCESEIFAINVHPLLKGRARGYRDIPAGFDGELVFHFSLGSPLSELYRSSDGARRSMIFHNLTHPEWFRGVNPRIVADLEAGQRQLPELCALSDRLIADSRFNAAELRAYGFEAEVLELPIDEEKWAIPANPGIAAMLRADPAVHVVHVGRLAPNKCIEDVIKTFYFLHHKINRQSRLWIVGIDIDTELYSFSLKRMVDEFDLAAAVNFVGCLADSELKALYQSATAYLCMSEHEGFCLPVIEAMYFDLPVIAFASSALPDTMGGGGVLVREKRHAEIAELIARIAEDAGLRRRLREAGRRRVQELRSERFEQRVRAIFGAAPAEAGGVCQRRAQ